MPFVRVFLAAFLTFLSGCSSRAVVHPIERRPISVGAADDVLDDFPKWFRTGALVAGVTNLHDGKPVGVRIATWVTRQDRDFGRTVCAHELGHVLGCTHTYGDEKGWMRWAHDFSEGPIINPTVDEMAEAHRYESFTLTLDATVTPEIRLAVEWAAWRWNRALGRKVFVVQK